MGHSLEAEPTAVTVSRADMRTVFHELAGLAGEAICTRAIQCSIQFNTYYNDPSEGPWRFGSFVLQVAGDDLERPGIHLAINKEGLGTYNEPMHGIGDWGSRNQTDEHPPHDSTTNLSARTILARAHDVIAAAPRLTNEPLLRAPRPFGYMNAAMSEPDFVPVLGNLLTLASEGLQYQEFDGAVDSASGFLATPRGRSHVLIASGKNNGVGVNFRMEYLLTSPYGPEDLQTVAFDCNAIIHPQEDRDRTVLYALDGLCGMAGGLYRRQAIVPLRNTRINEEISKEPIQPNDVIDLARSTLDPAAYLAERWPEF